MSHDFAVQTPEAADASDREALAAAQVLFEQEPGDVAPDQLRDDEKCEELPHPPPPGSRTGAGDLAHPRPSDAGCQPA